VNFGVAAGTQWQGFIKIKPIIRVNSVRPGLVRRAEAATLPELPF